MAAGDPGISIDPNISTMDDLGSVVVNLIQDASKSAKQENIPDPGEPALPNSEKQRIGDMSLEDILLQSGVVDAEIDAATNAIKTNNAKLQAVTTARAAEIKARASDEGAIVLQEESAKAKAQDNTAIFADTIGASANPDATSGIMLKLGDELRTQELKVDDTTKKMQDRLEGAGNNVWKKMIANFKNTSDGKLLKIQEARRDALKGGIQDINSSVQSTARTQVDLNPVVTQTTAAAAARIASSKVNDAAAQIEQQGLLYNREGIKDVLSMSEAQLTNKERVLSLQSLMDQREFQRTQAQMLAEARAEKLKDQQTVEEEMQQQLQDATVGFAKLGKAIPAVTAKQVEKYVKMGNELGKNFQDAVQVGANERILGSKGSISADSGTAAAIVLRTKASLLPEQKEVKNVLIAGLSAAQDGVSIDSAGNRVPVKDFNNTDAAKISGLATANIDSMAARASKNIASNDFSNPYQAPALADKNGKHGLNELKGIQNSKFYSKILAPAVENGMTDTDPQRITDLAIAAITEKKISLQDARHGINLIFAGARKMNNALKNYESVGFPRQEKYQTTVQLKDQFGHIYTSVSVDMSDTLQVNSLLTKAIHIKTEQPQIK